MGSEVVQTLNLEGLSCASCVAKAEKALMTVDGVKTASVNLAGRTASITGSPQINDLVQVLEDVGFGAEPAASNDTWYFSIPGISCAGCVARIEKALGAVAGVQDARVNLSDKIATVESSADVVALLNALEAIGKPGILIDSEQQNREKQEQADKDRYRYLIRHGAFALIFSLPMMVHMFFGDMSVNSVSDQLLWGSVGIVVLGILVFSGGHYFKGMWQNLKHGSANMDTLIALGTGAAWIYSMFVVLFPQWFPEAARHVIF